LLLDQLVPDLDDVIRPRLAAGYPSAPCRSSPMAKLIELTEIGDADGWGGDIGGGGSACRARNHAPASRLLGPCLPPILGSRNGPALLVAFPETTGPKNHPRYRLFPDANPGKIM